MDHTLHSAQFSMARKDDLGDDTDDLAPASPKLHSSLSVCRGKQDYLCSAQSTGQLSEKCAFDNSCRRQEAGHRDLRGNIVPKRGIEWQPLPMSLAVYSNGCSKARSPRPRNSSERQNGSLRNSSPRSLATQGRG